MLLLSPKRLLPLGLLLAALFPAAAAPRKPRIGVTLQPYYSWVANIVQGKAEVVPVLPGNLNPHAYQPRPEDIQNLEGLDAIVVNGIGHDDFIEPMLQASGNPGLPRIRPNAGLALLPAANAEATDPAGGPVAHNSHSFLSITLAIQQIQAIARELGRLDPPNAQAYEENARAYSKRLREILGSALARLRDLDTSRARIATVHDGYAYLFSELGLEITAVVQPRHGLEPSARQLADTIDRIRRANVNLLFTEMDLQSKYVDAIYAETGCRVLRLSHMSGGDYSAGKFEEDMRQNLDTIVQALGQP